MNHLCTITTVSHLYKVKALAESLRQGTPFMLHVLVVDSEDDFEFKDCRFYKLGDVKHESNAAEIIPKYRTDKNRLRWSLKPVLMKYLLEKQGLDKIIYLDNDLFFYSDYNFLFQLLDKYSFLLTPHYYKYSPRRDQNWFEANFRVGLFNAGFVGASQKGISTLQWWAECCAYRCEKNSFRGLFDDQKYLDLVTVIDENAHIVRHKGCNVAGWNTEVCGRTLVDNRVMIDGEYPVVFIHFNDTTVREIINGGDSILFNHYREYVEVLKNYNVDLKEKDLLFNQPFTDRLKFGLWKIVTEFGI